MNTFNETLQKIVYCPLYYHDGFPKLWNHIKHDTPEACQSEIDFWKYTDKLVTIPVVMIKTFDKEGSQFVKHVYAYNGMIYIGDIANYSLKQIKEEVWDQDLCIDIGGYSHQKSPVFISKEDMIFITQNLT